MKTPPTMRCQGLGLALVLACTAPLSQAQSAGGNPLEQLPTVRSPQPAAPTRATVDVQTPAGPAAAKLARVVTPTRFDIVGVKSLPFAEVAQLFAPLAGKPVPVSDLVALSQQATALYRAHGNPLSFVYVPDQAFEGGVVRVVAVEGYIASVRIEGDAGKAEPKLRAVAARLMAERPLTQAGFERITQLLSRQPGVTVEANASMPATTDGATELVLKVKRLPYNLSLGADLQQPTPRAVLSGVVNDPFVSGGQLSVSTLVGNPSVESLLTLGYIQAVGTDGLQLNTSFSDYRGYPDEQLGRGDAVERYNTNQRFELSASYPLFLSARTSVVVNGGFYAVDNDDDYTESATGGYVNERTKVRALFAQLAYADAQPDRARKANVLLAQGLNAMGASDVVTSNVDGLAGTGLAKPDFTRVAFGASQRNRYDNQWGSAFAIGGQYSNDSLASSERISFGGPNFGRAYAPGDAAGDSGLGVSAELNRQFKVDGTWIKQVEPFVLLEAANVRDKSSLAVPAQLRSIALGTRLSDNKYYSIDLAVAKPTGDPTSTNPQRKVRWSLLLSYQLSAL